MYTQFHFVRHRYKHSFFEHARFVTIAATSSAFTTTRQIKENQQKHTLKRGFWESEVFKAKPYLIIEGPFVTYIVFTFMYIQRVCEHASMWEAISSCFDLQQFGR